MANKDEDLEFAKISARAAEIKAGLDAAYTSEELRRPLSTRVVHSLIASSIASTAITLKSLSNRIAVLEERGIKYVGNYQRAAAYARGDTVTHSGSLWVALTAVPEGTAPGSDPAFWQLAEKGNSRARKKTGGQRGDDL